MWQSVAGSAWRVVFAVPAITSGSGGTETLSQGPFGTLLFSSVEATQLWTSHDDGSHWSLQLLPPEMAAEGVDSVTRSASGVDVKMVDKRGHLSTWTTTDGSHWHKIRP